ncbi:MAG: hypothetical protein AABY75_03485 [Bacteroidota bacterium]
MRRCRKTIFCLLMLAAVGTAQERPRTSQTVQFGVVPPKAAETMVSTATSPRRISEGTDRRKGSAVEQPGRSTRTTKVVTITD